MFFRKPAHPLRQPEAFTTQLSATPVRNAAAKVMASSEADRLVVAIDLKYTGSSRLFAGLLRTKKQKQYELEGLGLELYNRFDGNCAVEELIDELIERYKLTFFEARALVLTYLRMLTDRGLIVMAVKEAAAETSGDASEAD